MPPMLGYLEELGLTSWIERFAGWGVVSLVLWYVLTKLVRAVESVAETVKVGDIKLDRLVNLQQKAIECLERIATNGAKK